MIEEGNYSHSLIFLVGFSLLFYICCQKYLRMNRLPCITITSEYRIYRFNQQVSKTKITDNLASLLASRIYLSLPSSEAFFDGTQPQLTSAPRDSISIDDDDDDEEAMEVDSHEHDWRFAEFTAANLGRQQATTIPQLLTAGHYKLSSF